MTFPKEYFYDEVREGFYISGMMKRSWAAQLEVLDEVARVCKKYGIQWFADCGTLLGAVRHGGYVPWDDDLDICMLRDDYIKFHKYAVPELPERYVTLTFENEEYWQMITRVVNRGGISFEKEELEKYHGFPYAAGIDVFVLDYVAPDPGEEEVRRKLVNSVLEVGAIEGIDGDDPPQSGLELLQMVEETYQVKLDRKNHLRRQLYQIGERLSCLYPSEGAKEVVLMPFWCSHHDHKYPIECVNRVVQIPFETTMINVPAGYDAVLKVEYGDYLRVVRKGGIHEYPLYQIQEDYIAERLESGNPYVYRFHREDLNKEREQCPPRIKQRASEFCGLLRQIHGMLSAAAGNNPEQCLDLLEQSQEGIIRIGEEIENRDGEGTVTVSCIERYCEYIYETAQVLTGESDRGIDVVMQEMGASLDALEDSIQADLKEKKEILFLPFRSDLWESLDPIYRKAIADPDVHVTVMPLPFYDKDAAGNPGEMHYDVAGYPQDLNITNYQNYDIRAVHPDVIYIQNGYDGFNYTYMLPPAYFTSELKKYTEQLIYVPYFKLGGYEPEDQKLRQTTRYFMKIPGVMHADRVWIENEEIRQLYIEELVSFCGEDTAQIWEEKLEVMAMQQEEQNKKDIPQSWESVLYKANGEKKKTVLFMNAVCSLYQHQEQALTKLKDVLRIFAEKQEEIALIWRPHPSVAISADLFDRQLWLEYRRIVEEYRSAGWGILDETPDADLSIGLADAYYGDPDPVMQRCRVAGKPVMIADARIM
ncbi:MAG: LicD family protein [Lachnospiraceae bacterium]|nr:LicD family protein [Lachnospiraceae bacterium]